MDVQEKLNKTVRDAQGALWIKNIEANRKYIDESVPMVKTARVCIIVGAGPSLTDCMEYLRYARENLDVFIICVDTAIRPMLKAGITPDAIISIDSKKDIRHFIGKSKDLPLIAYTTSNPAVLEWHKGKKTFINHSICLENKDPHLLIKGLPLLGSGCNVATVALAYAAHIKYRKIVFVGVDLSADVGLSYAQGCLRENLPVEQLGVRELRIAKLWVESFLRDNWKIKLTNITRYGLRIEGADNKLI